MGKLRLRKRKCLSKSLKPGGPAGSLQSQTQGQPLYLSPSLLHSGVHPTSLGGISLLSGRQPFCMTTAKRLRLSRVNDMPSFPQISLSWAEKEKNNNNKKGCQVHCLSKYLTSIKNSTESFVVIEMNLESSVLTEGRKRKIHIVH